MPPWVDTELTRLIFDSFWGGKRDLAARRVLYCPREHGGFSVVSVSLKVYSLLAQWVRRLKMCHNGWVYLLTYWLFDRFGATPHDAFADPSVVSLDRLPPFYAALFRAWIALRGHSCSSGLLVGLGSGCDPLRVSTISCKSCYCLLISLNLAQPHCVAKYGPFFGPIDWSSSWRSLYFMPLDRRVIDVCWQISHGVLYTVEHLSSFRYNISTSCFCGAPLESLEHLFFSCPLAQSGLAWVQSLLSRASSLAPSISVKHCLVFLG